MYWNNAYNITNKPICYLKLLTGDNKLVLFTYTFLRLEIFIKSLMKNYYLSGNALPFGINGSLTVSLVQITVVDLNFLNRWSLD